MPTMPPLSEPLARAKRLIRDVPNFPKAGILFRDVTPLLASHQALTDVVDALAEKWPAGSVDAVAGIESRGFIFGTALALKLGVGFIPIRKKGKLPFKTESVSYGLEYGSDQLEIHVDACATGAKVLVCDDLLATGGTANAAVQLIERVGGTIAGFSFVVELMDLGGRSRLGRRRVEALIAY